MITKARVDRFKSRLADLKADLDAMEQGHKRAKYPMTLSYLSHAATNLKLAVFAVEKAARMAKEKR
jgi:hypothetical protein